MMGVARHASAKQTVTRGGNHSLTRLGWAASRRERLMR